MHIEDDLAQILIMRVDVDGVVVVGHIAWVAGYQHRAGGCHSSKDKNCHLAEQHTLAVDSIVDSPRRLVEEVAIIIIFFSQNKNLNLI